MTEPLFLQGTMHEKIWGGQRLKTVFNYDIPSDKTGEYWAISAHANGVSLVSNGAFKGVGLDDLYQRQPALFGYPKSKAFPLLTKILDANDWLSVQVHPDDAYAMAHEGELGKTECWYVLEADEGAEIIYGHTAQTKTELKGMISSGQWDDLLTRVPVKKGDFFYVPSGTMHAIGQGILILETQQSSDTTYRVYDFDRPDNQGTLRELHLKQSIDVMSYGPVENSHPATLRVGDLTTSLLVSNQFFTVYRWQLSGQADFRQAAPYYLVSVIDGQGSLQLADKAYPLSKGDHFILPNDVTSWRFEGHLDLIVSHSND
ncbi:mannose-6-phosphate isomerase, class I [Streptococcus cuniculipharyngis]|uniref:Mannose-6-phosphate isomerase n=1 Tax=Streptococcus cuniculipharyngis TaxID=1562651 RepID=A0A5C5SB31_9STRE|nr:mannose-6-phosphate isomerase, class I [Streptococcus cuniculipharyngis]TWS96469.1 mannose-6-phosphate isomerase, class I [Streptococcus cuniculipharyngis]